MFAAIDVGSNTLRMLVARCAEEGFKAVAYDQKITRLAGGYSDQRGLAKASIDRTLEAFSEFCRQLNAYQIEQVRAVGTAALRRAANAQHLVKQIKLKTRLELEIIDGVEEARLSAAGVLSVLNPPAQTALIIDIGGGSTELVLYDAGKILFCCSYPLGVVQLYEELPEAAPRQAYLRDMVVKFSADLLHAGISPLLFSRCELVATAGTATTLAALNLQLRRYDRTRVNNQQLSLDWLLATEQRLAALTVAEREALPGIEAGRGDIVLPGLELLIAICRYFQRQSLRVADAGLLEGILLDFCRC